jgi:hypothetical protein
MRVLFLPGDQSPVLILDDVLRERHEDIRASRAQEIALRKEKGAPLDTETDWGAVQNVVAELSTAAGARDTDAVARLATLAAAGVDGRKLVEIPAYQPIEHYRSVKVQFVALADNVRRRLLRDVVAAQEALDAEDSEEAHVSRHVALGEFIKAAVVSIDGYQQVDDAVVDGLAISGMLLDVFVAARDYQRLSLGKGDRFGSPAPST